MEIPGAVLKRFQPQQNLRLEKPVAASFCRMFDLRIFLPVPV